MRSLRAGLAVVAAAAVVLAGQLVERPADEPATPTQTAGTVPVSEAELVCPGAPLRGLDGVADISVPSSVAGQVPPAEAAASSTPGAPEGGTLTARPLGGDPREAQDGARRVTDRDAAQGSTLTGEGDLAAGLVGAEQVVVRSDSVAGGSTAPCSTSRADQWLVGGGAGAGRQERLLLVNPGENPVSVDITALSSRGTSRPAAGQDIVVPPGSRTALLLDGVTGGREAQVLRVTATGGPVGAWLVDHWMSGLTPRGLEVVPATAEPERQHVLGALPEAETVRVVLGAPGARDAIVTVRAIDDRRGHAVGVVTVPAGRTAVVEVPPKDSPHALSVTADEPVVAAAEVVGLPSTRGGEGDVAWSVAGPPVEDLVGTAVPAQVDGLERHLVVSSPLEVSEVEVLTVTAGRSTVDTVVLEKDRARVLEVGDAEAVWVRRLSGDGVRASMLTRGTAARAAVLSVTPLLRARVSDPAVDVVPLP